MKNYQHVDDLPEALKDEFPEAAQEMYLAVYRRTWEKCATGGDVSEDELAALAHDAALLAVQGRFDKDERGHWRQAPVGAEIDPTKPPDKMSDGDR